MRFCFFSSVDSDDSDGNEINNPNKEEKKGKKFSWWKKKKSSKTEEAGDDDLPWIKENISKAGNEINNPNKEEKKGKKLSWWKKKKSSKTEEEEGPMVKVDGEVVLEAVMEILNVVHQIIDLPQGAVPVEVEAGASGTVSWNVKPQKLLGGTKEQTPGRSNSELMSVFQQRTNAYWIVFS